MFSAHVPRNRLTRNCQVAVKIRFLLCGRFSSDVTGRVSALDPNSKLAQRNSHAFKEIAGVQRQHAQDDNCRAVNHGSRHNRRPVRSICRDDEPRQPEERPDGEK